MKKKMATRMYVCESVEHPSSLLMGLNEQRLQGQLCDVTVRVQGHLFKAHTNILASAMGYFRDLFLNPTKQVKKDIIEIPMIVNSIGFAKVLDFIYTSQLCLSQSSVMQVLCSACYLQIPYVVDKCQEFIVTHGHSSPQNTFPTLTDQRYLSNKMTENQECELINTPPSPGNQSTSTGNRDEQSGVNAASPVVGIDGNDHSPVEAKIENSENPSDANPASRALMEFSQQSRFSDGKSGALKMLLQNEGNNDSDTIDHESLAEYFARNAVANFNDGSLAPQVGNFLGNGHSNSTPSSENHLYSMSKSMRESPTKDASSPTSSVSQYLLAMKKEKPKKEYRCEYCNKLFGRQQHLKRHILTHTGERPYPCNQCDKRFRRSEHLKHHLVKHQQQDLNASATSTGATSTGSLIDFSTTGRKRSRKPVPSDAYGMSKMMLVSYNQQRFDDPSDNKAQDKDLIGSNPVASTKLNNSLDNISQKLASLVRGVAKEQNSPESVAQTFQVGVDSPTPMALNLSGKDALSTETKVSVLSASVDNSPTAKSEHFDGSPTPHSDGSPHDALDMSTNSSNPTNTEDARNSVDGDLSNVDETNPVSVTNGQEASNNMSIDNFASSEVVTNDLKRLFAAMDE